MKCLMLTGDRSGSGKTSISLAIAALLSRERSVQTFKVGMDYIDPSYLTAVTGRPCRNLDSFVMEPGEIRSLFGYGCQGGDIALIEGVRGLFEGADAIGDTGSTASIAKYLGIGVVLVVDARSITRSAAALVKGFQAFDPEVDICGVIFNNIGSRRHQEKATRAVEHYCGVPVIGAVPRTDEMKLTMRHLGLVPYREGQVHTDFHKRIDLIRDVIGRHLDMDLLLETASDCSIPMDSRDLFGDTADHPDPDIRIGVAYDEAFNFYYPEMFDILRACGAECIRFSTLDDRLPEADGYIFGGGYPEMFAADLEANAPMREAVCEVSGNGTPVYAECGGLLYLTDRIVLNKGWQGCDEVSSYEMCGVFPGECRMPSRRVLGYVEGVSGRKNPFGAFGFRGHEFHYTDVRLAPGAEYVYRLTRGEGIAGRCDGVLADRTLASYSHLHPVTCRGMLERFAACCRESR